MNLPLSRLPAASMAKAVLGVLEQHGQPRKMIDGVAAELGVSVRTLQTALAKEQTSFRAIRRRCQIRDATTLLTATDLPIGTVANRVGYTNPANFHRAFVAITGTTPMRYRVERRDKAH